MTVTTGVLGNGEQVDFEGKGWNTNGKIRFQNGHPSHDQTSALQYILEIAANCNDAKLVTATNENDEFEVLGDPTEGALLVAAEKFLHNFNSALCKPELQKKFSFDSNRKMMSTLHTENEREVLYVKGAPEILLQKCTSWWDGEEVKELDTKKRTEILQTVSDLSDQALRILAFAKREFSATSSPQNGNEAEQDLVFYGLLGMIDPARKAVPDAVQAAHAAGVRTIIITGDNPKTATAIARQVGIIQEKDPIILLGDDLKKMDDAELTAKLFERKDSSSQQYRGILFARTAPEDKMRIVSLLQQNGEIVAVTGDGVNDAPALKKADIGITMGIAGTEVSKEAASMILLDDSFATIVSAIREGRKIFENLKKFLWFLFSGNIGELIVIITTLLIAVPAPLTAVLILLVNLGTDILPAIALSFEKAEEEIMHVPPRNPKVHILQRGFVLHFVWLGVLLAATVLIAFLWILFSNGWSWGMEVSTALHAKGHSVAFNRFGDESDVCCALCSTFLPFCFPKVF